MNKDQVFVLVDTPEKCKRAYEILINSGQQMGLRTREYLKHGNNCKSSPFLLFDKSLSKWFAGISKENATLTTLDDLEAMLCGKGEDKISTSKVKQFLLGKFPPSKYFDCPVPKHHWETMQEYADQQTAALRKELEEKGNRMALYEQSFNDFMEVSKDQIGQKNNEIDELKRKLKQYLPEDCVRGHGEVKFCDVRNGEGNECKNCCDY